MAYLFALERRSNCSASCSNLAKDIGIVNGLCRGNALTNQVNAQEMHSSCN